MSRPRSLSQCLGLEFHRSTLTSSTPLSWLKPYPHLLTSSSWLAGRDCHHQSIPKGEGKSQNKEARRIVFFPPNHTIWFSYWTCAVGWTLESMFFFLKQRTVFCFFPVWRCLRVYMRVWHGSCLCVPFVSIGRVCGVWTLARLMVQNSESDLESRRSVT